MSALEQELIDRIRQLDEASQRRVLAFVLELEPKPFDFEQWMKDAEAFRTRLREQYGENYVVGGLQLLEELREEASWPRL
jgi:hypothetical protein